MRKNRTLLLTEEGQAYYLDIKDIFSSIHEATDKLLARGEKGTITVSLMPSFAIQWLIPRLSDFSAQHPDVDVKIKAVDLAEHSLTEDVDIAIYYGRGKWSNLYSHQLHQEYLIPVCSPLLLTGKKPLDTIDDLKYQTLLHDSGRRDWQRWFNAVGVQAVNVNNGPIFSHSSMVLQAAIHGQGVALAHSFLAKPDINSGRLICPFENVLESKDAYYIVGRPEQQDIGKIIAFREWILETVANEQVELDELSDS